MRVTGALWEAREAAGTCSPSISATPISQSAARHGLPSASAYSGPSAAASCTRRDHSHASSLGRRAGISRAQWYRRRRLDETSVSVPHIDHETSVSVPHNGIVASVIDPRCPDETSVSGAYFSVDGTRCLTSRHSPSPSPSPSCPHSFGVKKKEREKGGLLKAATRWGGVMKQRKSDTAPTALFFNDLRQRHGRHTGDEPHTKALSRC